LVEHTSGWRTGRSRSSFAISRYHWNAAYKISLNVSLRIFSFLDLKKPLRRVEILTDFFTCAILIVKPVYVTSTGLVLMEVD
jgi:hypothetical protein